MTMRRILAGLALAAVLASPVAAAKPLTAVSGLVNVNQYDSAAGNPSFPQRCHFDDQTFHTQAKGTLAPGETWTLVSPKPVCYYRLVSLVVYESRSQGKFSPLSLTLTDYDGHVSPVRFDQPDSRTQLYRTCNTDLGRAHVTADPFAPTSSTPVYDPDGTFSHYTYELIGEDAGHRVTWSVTNTGTTVAVLDVRADITELQWMGDWGGSTACVSPVPQ
jgi:hypothetical protein